MVIIVATLYALSQLPRHIVYLVTLNDANAFQRETMMYIWLFCQLCTWSATCYNPFIYSWMNRTFRRGMADLLRRAFCLPQINSFSRRNRRSARVAFPETLIEFEALSPQGLRNERES